jgi:hypothetical protein
VLRGNIVISLTPLCLTSCYLINRLPTPLLHNKSPFEKLFHSAPEYNFSLTPLCLTSCYLINRLPTPLLHNKSPFEKLFHSAPDYNFLKVFGCACFPNLRPFNSHKFSPRSKECVFLGYSTHHKGYKCLHIESGRM